MLYETAARASEILALNIEDLDLEQRRAPVRSKGGNTEFVYWDTSTAHLLPRLLRLPDGTPRTSGPLFLASRRPVPARRPAPRDICPHTGRARLGYDRARVLLKKYTATAASEGLELHQLRHFRGDPPRRPEGPAAADHGQDPAQVSPHRHALRQTWRRGRGRGHQPARPAAAQPLTQATTLRLARTSGILRRVRSRRSTMASEKRLPNQEETAAGAALSLANAAGLLSTC